MHRVVKKLLLGLITWAVPFVVSFFVWDVQTGGPSIPVAWFNALVGVSLAIGYSICAYYWFKQFGKEKDVLAKSWMTGFVWWAELLVLDLLFLVLLFEMSLGQYYPIVFTYLSVWIFTGLIGHILKK